MRKEMWDAIDINGNGYLSLAEVTGVRKRKILYVQEIVTHFI